MKKQLFHMHLGYDIGYSGMDSISNDIYSIIYSIILLGVKFIQEILHFMYLKFNYSIVAYYGSLPTEKFHLN